MHTSKMSTREPEVATVDVAPVEEDALEVAAVGPIAEAELLQREYLVMLHQPKQVITATTGEMPEVTTFRPTHRMHLGGMHHEISQIM